MANPSSLSEGRHTTKDASFLPNVDRGMDTARRYLAERKAREGSAQIVNPQTPPSRFISSTYSSPGSILGKEEDAVIIELNPRYLLAGIEGESSPQCKIVFNPEDTRRIGDYRVWLQGYQARQENIEEWGKDYELWRNDIGGLDGGLISDKLERAVREAYNKYLLLDAGSARLVLVIPTVLPHPILETVLSTLFERWKFPTITLLPSSTMSIISAGLRSALVVDIGWEETTVTAICEYRETQSCRSTRAMKEVTQKFGSLLKKVIEQRPDSKSLRFDLNFVEEVMTRTLMSVDLTDTDKAATRSKKLDDVERSSITQASSYTPADYEVEWPSGSTTELVRISKASVRECVTEALLDDRGDQYPDDHELALSKLIYKLLLTLSSDMRSTCLPRIMFIGDAAGIPGLVTRTMNGVSDLIERNGWSEVRGQHIKQRNTTPSQSSHSMETLADAQHNVLPDPEGDMIEAQVRKRKGKTKLSPVPTELRNVESLGAWAGASLLTSLKIRGFVEIEREKFLSHGLAGASRSAEISVLPQPQRMSSFGIPKPVKAPDRMIWTLAGWG